MSILDGRPLDEDDDEEEEDEDEGEDEDEEDEETGEAIEALDSSFNF